MDDAADATLALLGALRTVRADALCASLARQLSDALALPNGGDLEQRLLSDLAHLIAVARRATDHRHDATFNASNRLNSPLKNSTSRPLRDRAARKHFRDAFATFLCTARGYLHHR